MKIDVKLSPRQLNTLVHSFNSLSVTPINHRSIKVARSILDKTVIKFRKKHIEVASEFSSAKKTKKYNFSLEYYEAHYLENFLGIAEQFPMSEYDRNVLRMIKDGLNQKLA